jgi:hypothetical protein
VVSSVVDSSACRNQSRRLGTSSCASVMCTSSSVSTLLDHLVGDVQDAAERAGDGDDVKVVVIEKFGVGPGERAPRGPRRILAESVVFAFDVALGFILPARRRGWTAADPPARPAPQSGDPLYTPPEPT